MLRCGGKSGGGDYRKRSRLVECARVERKCRIAGRERKRFCGLFRAKRERLGLSPNAVEWLSYQEDKNQHHDGQDKEQSKETRFRFVVLQAGV
jgi:hypothetical protein